MATRAVPVVIAALFLCALPGGAIAQSANAGVEEAVRVAFADVPVMISIARCESEFRQFADDGMPLRGGLGNGMVGIFQIHEDIHAAYAAGLGYDIHTLKGNMDYARYLYEREGTQPWMSSFPCWNVTKGELELTAGTIQPAREASPLSANLSFGMEHPEVRTLQQLLNRAGFVVSAEGPGSPGQETEKFGSLTRAAVRKFQCETMQICDGDEYSSGYGFVGPKTRAALVGSTAKSTTASSVALSASSAAPPPPGAPAPEAGTPPTAAYTVEQLNEVARLQAQIAELMAILAKLKGQ